ncbi:hypothetical protein [Euryhalocaulis caribicus]|uniref:hypothetical protein n=1 Tax=Euryhalocaulis caribicus TaxID=1161401 RepID=UPI00126973A8|nr:hypothetical protein [Euryhalocaulis caribicus]
MKTVIFILGPQGAGKSTAMASLQNHPKVVCLQSFTTRKRRLGEKDEYLYLRSPPEEIDVAWGIKRSTGVYGVLKSEIHKISDNKCGVVTFDPEMMDDLEQIIAKNNIKIITVGLDNMHNLDTQHKRVGYQLDRVLTLGRLRNIKARITRTDYVLRGDKEETRSELIRIISEIT